MKATFDLTWESKKPSAGNHLPNFAGFDEKYQLMYCNPTKYICYYNISNGKDWVLQSNKIKENLDLFKKKKSRYFITIFQMEKIILN